MITNILLVLVAAIVLLAVYITTRPAQFRIARSRTIAAPPAVVHAYVNDFRKWTAWSPWEKRDPALARDYGGPPSGTGATYAWKGNKDVGEGRMTITDSQPPRGITIKLEFIKPFPATNTTQFDFLPSGSGTQVNWTMDGHNNFMGKAFAAFVNMDQLIGKDFEQGLANLEAATSAVRSLPPS